MRCGGRVHTSSRTRAAAIESLEKRQLFWVEHALTDTALAGAFQPQVSLAPGGPTGSGADISLEPVGAEPGQVNGNAIFGGGIYGPAAASYTARAEGSFWMSGS